jgi:hypothetical protein
MGTTAALALRYPDGTDRVADGALAIQHLAEDVEAKLDLLVNPPRCRVYQTATTTLTTAVAAALAFDTEDSDEAGANGMHNPAVNPSRVTIVQPGVYRVLCQVSFAFNAAGYRTVGVLKNGAVVAATRLMASPTVSHFQQAYLELPLVAGDYVECQALQASGGNLATVAGAANTFLHVAYASAT